MFHTDAVSWPVRFGVGTMFFLGGMFVFFFGLSRGSKWAVAGWGFIVGGFALAFQALIAILQAN